MNDADGKPTAETMEFVQGVMGVVKMDHLLRESAGHPHSREKDSFAAGLKP